MYICFCFFGGLGDGAGSAAISKVVSSCVSRRCRYNTELRLLKCCIGVFYGSLSLSLHVRILFCSLYLRALRGRPPCLLRQRGCPVAAGHELPFLLCYRARLCPCRPPWHLPIAGTLTSCLKARTRPWRVSAGQWHVLVLASPLHAQASEQARAVPRPWNLGLIYIYIYYT